MNIKTQTAIICLVILNPSSNVYTKWKPTNSATYFPLNADVGFGSKNVEFVNIIKEDLHRNNDDYADRALHNVSNPYLDTTESSTATGTVQHKIIKSQNINKYSVKDMRRAYSVDSSDAMNRGKVGDFLPQDDKGKEFTELRITPMARNSKRFLKITIEPQKVTKPPEHEIITNEHVDRNKAKKLLKFINQKNSLFDKSIKRNSIGGQTVAMRARPSGLGSAAPVPRAVSPDVRRQLPSGDQLDMAHAKGPRIHAMRIKSQLCYRSVLHPEGPKYDSKGKVYKSGFMKRSRGGRIKRVEFANTRMPPLLLPRCCNCCKKSVLGCE